MIHSRRLSLLTLVVLLLTSQHATAQSFDFELINDGEVIANTNDLSNDDTAFPSVIKVPSWVTTRPDPNANYYLYYGNHSGEAIKMKWAQSLDGIWTDYNFTNGTGNSPSVGVFDVGLDTNDDTRNGYDHISAPDVVIDNVNQQFIMYFHGRRLAGDGVPQVHERFVATSGTGLNFNDPNSGNGEAGFGPIEVTSNGVTRDVWIGDDYMKTFQKDGNWYGVGKRCIINAAPTSGSIFAPRAGDPFGEAWDRADTPESNWVTLTSGLQDQYYSPGATFLASQEFADHPNNPIGRRVLSNGGDERLNHVEVNLLPDDLLEVYFTVRERRNSDPDDFNAIYRIVYDVSDPDFQNWTVARDDSGQVLFDVVLTPEDFTAAVVESVGENYNASRYADPVSFGDTELFFDDDGSTYLFFSYQSDAFGGGQGEGAITAVLLNPCVLGDADGSGEVNNVDIMPFALALFNRSMYVSMFPDLNPEIKLDMNGDGFFNNQDIMGFATALGF